MIEKSISVLTFLSALGCGLIAGAFFAFSTFVMKALGRLPAAQGIAAMQSINIVVINPIFMTAMFGTGVACFALAVLSVFKWYQPGTGYLLAGGLLYITGTILVTILFNVPRNDALASVNPTSAEGVTLWSNYLSSWTNWNHVRTMASLVAAALFTVALVKLRSLE